MLASQTPEFLGKGVLADELLSGNPAVFEQDGEFAADVPVPSDARGVTRRLFFDCRLRSARGAAFAERFGVGPLVLAPEPGTGLRCRHNRFAFGHLVARGV